MPKSLAAEVRTPLLRASAWLKSCRSTLLSTSSRSQPSADGCDLDDVLSKVERQLLSQALARSNGVRTSAAKLLGISFRSLRYRLSKLGMSND